jgi:hypothetical protein
MKVGSRIKKLGKIDQERFLISLIYEDGFRGVADLSHLFAQTQRRLTAEILRGDMFTRCFINNGALAWPNGYELCPDTLRAIIEAAQKRSAA